MPFQSEKQKKWMWANKPEMAREWTSKYGSKIEAKKGIMAKKDKNWIQKATKNMRKDKPCTGKKFGGPTCPPGTRRYNLAKTFRKMNKAATGTMVKADTGKLFGWGKDKKWYNNPKKLEKMMTKLRGEYSLMKDSMAGKVSPTLIEKGKKLAKEKGFGWKSKDEAKGGPYKPGYKPQLSVRTAKRGIFNTGMPPATKYKKYLKTLRTISLEKAGILNKKTGKTTHEGMKKLSTKGLKGRSLALGKMELSHLAKVRAANKAIGALPFIERRRQLSTAGSVAKTLLKRTGFGKALAVATAAGAGYEAGKRNLLKMKKKKVQKKATGGEIIIGRGVDIDLL